jgi:hypothetical protein
MSELVVLEVETLRGLIASVVREALDGKVGRVSFDERSAAGYLGIGRSTLAALRAAGQGPAYGLRGGRVVYDQRDLEAYCEATRIVPSAAPNARRTARKEAR